LPDGEAALRIRVHFDAPELNHKLREPTDYREMPSRFALEGFANPRITHNAVVRDKVKAEDCAAAARAKAITIVAVLPATGILHLTLKANQEDPGKSSRFAKGQGVACIIAIEREEADHSLYATVASPNSTGMIIRNYRRQSVSIRTLNFTESGNQR
jgi:hypothetical protein